MIASVDYGVGNLFSLKSSFDYIGEPCIVTGEAREIRRCERILLPGVGAFADAAQKLRDQHLDAVIIGETKKGKPLLGVCLGMQLLLARSLEYGEHKGLCLIDGSILPVRPVIPKDYKVPHIGWNALHFANGNKHPLFQFIEEGDFVYFVHSYYAAECAGAVIATAEYGAELTAAVAKDNVMGVQFHPEKSGEVGLRILKAFCAL